jgi:hypothetical protein
MWICAPPSGGPGHGLLHPGQRLARAFQIATGDAGADQDDQRLAVFGLEVPVGVTVLRRLEGGRLAAQELGLQLLEADRSCRLIVFQPEIQRLADCLLPLAVQLGVQLLEIVDAGEEARTGRGTPAQSPRPRR